MLIVSVLSGTLHQCSVVLLPLSYNTSTSMTAVVTEQQGETVDTTLSPPAIDILA